MKNQNNIKFELQTKLPLKFFDLLNKAILYSPTEDQTNESLNSCDYNEKQTRLRKSEDTLD